MTLKNDKQMCFECGKLCSAGEKHTFEDCKEFVWQNRCYVVKAIKEGKVK